MGINQATGARTGSGREPQSGGSKQSDFCFTKSTGTEGNGRQGSRAKGGGTRMAAGGVQVRERKGQDRPALKAAAAHPPRSSLLVFSTHDAVCAGSGSWADRLPSRCKDTHGMQAGCTRQGRGLGLGQAGPGLHLQDRMHKLVWLLPKATSGTFQKGLTVGRKKLAQRRAIPNPARPELCLHGQEAGGAGGRGQGPGERTEHADSGSFPPKIPTEA